MIDTYYTLIRREFWERRGTFLVLPLVMMAGFISLMLLMFLLFGLVGIETSIDVSDSDEHGSREWHYESDQASLQELLSHLVTQLDHMPTSERMQAIRGGLFGIGAPFQVVLWLVVFFYMLGALYDDRKDRSILFWKSMPVSDRDTVLAKLLAGGVIVPLVYAACAMGTQLAVLSIGSLFVVGEGLPLWEAVWEPARLLYAWGEMFILSISQLAWGLPFYGWLLLVSATARNVPLAWAVGLPIGVAFVEGIVRFDQTSIVPWFWSHWGSLYMMRLDENWRGLPEHLFSQSTLTGVVLGIAMLVAAIWRRGKADEI